MTYVVKITCAVCGQSVFQRAMADTHIVVRIGALNENASVYSL